MFVERIDQLGRGPQVARSYIGASTIGHDCTAYIALGLRGMPDDPPSEKTFRIFDMGHWIEGEVVDYLRRAGFVIEEVDPSTGEQWRYTLHANFVKGHADGKIIHDHEPLLLEVKSMNAANFNKFVKHGLNKSHPHYFAQMQLLMGMAMWKRGVLIAYNKNTSELAEEIVEFDPIEYSALRHKATSVLSNQVNRLSNTQDHWKCRGCFKKTACKGLAKVEPDCRHCQHSLPHSNGQYFCTLHDWFPEEACDDFRVYNPGFDPFED
jgi:hypothetical protein